MKKEDTWKGKKKAKMEKTLFFKFLNNAGFDYSKKSDFHF